MPLVSVVMAVRDGARYLDAAVRSVLDGPFADLELVAVDDGSTDATREILAGWAARDARVRVETLGRPGGPAAARNRGLALARGEFVAPHDADDVFVAERLMAQVAALRDGAALATGGMEVIDARGRRLYARALSEAPEVIAHILAFGNPIAHGTVLYRRGDALDAGGYDESQVGSHDYDLWLRLAARGPVAALPLLCLRYRLHDDQITVRDGARQREESFANTHRALGARLGHDPDPAGTDAAAHVWRETGALCDLAAADCLFREAFAHAPPSARPRIATITAEHLVGHASRLALAGHPVAALRCLRLATRWDRRAVAPLVVRRIAWLATVRYRSR